MQRMLQQRRQPAVGQPGLQHQYVGAGGVHRADKRTRICRGQSLDAVAAEPPQWQALAGGKYSQQGRGSPVHFG